MVTDDAVIVGRLGMTELASNGQDDVCPESERSRVTARLCVTLIDSVEGLRALATECDDLAMRMRPRLPFATASWLETWWQHYRAERLWVRDQLYVHTVRDEYGRLLGIAPLLLTERPGSGPFRSRSISFFGTDKNVTELRGLICAPEHEALVTRVLLDHFAAREEEWDWINWNGAPASGDAFESLNSCEHFEWTRETTDYVLALPSTWDEFRATRSRNIKESLRKCYNSLKRDGHSFEFRVVSEPAALGRALERFFELHSRRAKLDTGVKHPDVFATTQARALLMDLAPSMCAFQLEIAGEVVATRLGFRMGDELYLYFSGYEPEWGRYSVMTTTVAETLKWAIEHGIRQVNLSPGTDVSKTRWGATPIITRDGVLLSSTRRGRMAFGVLSELKERSRPGTLLSRVIGLAQRQG